MEYESACRLTILFWNKAEATVQKWAIQAIETFVGVLSRPRYNFKIAILDRRPHKRTFEIESEIGTFFLEFSILPAIPQQTLERLKLYLFQERFTPDPWNLSSDSITRFRVFEAVWEKNNLPKIRQFATSNMKRMIKRMQYASVHQIMNA
jgi:hypothetical protein